jgi:hypothetical protein
MEDGIWELEAGSGKREAGRWERGGRKMELDFVNLVFCFQLPTSHSQQIK